MKLAFCISTYNRLDYLKQLLNCYYKTKNNKHDWHIYIADDGSTDGTIEYIDTLEINTIKLNRTGLCNSMNMLIYNSLNDGIEYGFRTDDDVILLDNGWDDLYISSSIRSGYDHLVNFNKEFASNKHGIDYKIMQNQELLIQSYIGNILHAQGAFFTFTPRLIESIGYFDNTNFSGCGFHHVDFTMRACRAGFNSISNHGPFDAISSEKFVSLQIYGYKRARGKFSKIEKKRRIAILLNEDRETYIELRKETVSRKFSGDWTTFYTDNWMTWLHDFIGKDNIHGLEVGCYEGRSSCWFCDNILTGNMSTLTCVDKFGKYKGKMIEPIFDHNTSGLKITKLKGQSRIELAKLIMDKKKFDFIYIDGDHHRTPVLIDFVNCWQLIRSGGVIICDDYHYAGVRVSVNSALRCFKYSIKDVKKTGKINRKRIQIAIWKK